LEFWKFLPNFQTKKLKIFFLNFFYVKKIKSQPWLGWVWGGLGVCAVFQVGRCGNGDVDRGIPTANTHPCGIHG
jgi:hypothetical protein